MKLVVFSICKDEAETIGEVLDRIPQKIKGISEIEKLVISDGSTDETVAIAKKHGATVIEGLTQKRLAFRFEQAVEKVLEMGADVAVNIDGDLQFNPEDIPKMVLPIIEEHYDFVAADRFTDADTGSRRRPKNMSVNKYLANIVGTWIVGNLTRQSFRDVTCGFRAYNRKALLALNLNSNYTYTQESFQMLALKKMDIKAVPVKVKYYEGRKSRVVTNFFKFMAGSAINIIRAYRDFAPLRFFGGLGLVFFVFGFAASVFTLIHWLNTGRFSPYIFVAFIGVYFVSLALIVWVVGLMADMFDRILNNQEKIIEHIKKQRYESKNKKRN